MGSHERYLNTINTEKPRRRHERKKMIECLAAFPAGTEKISLVLTIIETKTYFLRELNPGPEEMQPKITIN